MWPSANLRKIPPSRVRRRALQRAVRWRSRWWSTCSSATRRPGWPKSAASRRPGVGPARRAADARRSFGPILVSGGWSAVSAWGCSGGAARPRRSHVHHPAMSRNAWGSRSSEQSACGLAQRQARGSASQVIEALRGVRLSVAHRTGRTGDRHVTSPGRADGKSFVGSRTWRSVRGRGCRTLLIDGDVRRGRLHHVSTASPPGLTDILAGSCRGAGDPVTSSAT